MPLVEFTEGNTTYWGRTKDPEATDELTKLLKQHDRGEKGGGEFCPFEAG